MRTAFNPLAVYFGWIEAQLLSGARVQTRDLEEHYELSRASASKALSEYARLFPQNVTRVGDHYVKGPRMRAAIVRGISTEAFLHALERLADMSDAIQRDREA